MTTIPQRTPPIAARQIAFTAAEQAKAIEKALSVIRENIARSDRYVWPASIRLTLTDGWPARNGDGGSSSGISDPVASMALSRDGRVMDVVALRVALVAAVEASERIHEMLRVFATSVPSQALTAVKVHLCAAHIQMPGYGEWGIKDAAGAPTACNDLPSTNPSTGTPDRDGLCSKCYQRRRRWQTVADKGFS